MTTLEARYLPTDRLQAILTGSSLPTTVEGSALFADISGFTPITEKLRLTLGVRRGAELLAAHLNRVYDALIAQVECYGGTIIGFAGDAITCWFDGAQAAQYALGCAFGLLEAMESVERIELPNRETAVIGLKVSIATGTARRFVVGDPNIQLIDTLTGATVMRMAAGERAAQRGEALADEATVETVGAVVREWREKEGIRFAVLERPPVLANPPPQKGATPRTFDDAQLRPWLLPAVVGHFKAGLGEYLTELRSAVALFVRFTGIDYDDDPDAQTKLDRFVQMAQGVLARYEGNILHLAIGDKGSYFCAALGTPFAHEDDTARALDAALDIRAGAFHLGYLDSVQMGITRGVMRTGAYGGETRRTYGVLGDEVNLAARLMGVAEPGTILVSGLVALEQGSKYLFEALPPLLLKGKEYPVEAFRLVGQREQGFQPPFYPGSLVGRDSELSQVKAHLAPIFEGKHAGLLFIYGEPGIGKTRLAYEARQQLEAERRMLWLTGQTNDLLRTPLNAFAYFMRPYFGQNREHDAATNQTRFNTAFDLLLASIGDSDVVSELEHYRSFLAGLVGVRLENSPYELADDRGRIDSMTAALKAFARAEGHRQPLVIQIEDANLLDPSSIRAIQQMTYNMNEVPLAIVLTSRYKDDGSHFTIDQIFDVPVTSVDLNHLTGDGVRAVAESMLGGRVSDQLAQLICDKAEGNPFFTEQLVLDLRERNALTETNGIWDIRANAVAQVPSGVNAVLIARLDRLSAQVKAVVQTASVLGREFDVFVLSRMLRDSEQDYIRSAEEQGIWSLITRMRYLFRHAMLRDAAYAMQLDARLRELHRLAAESIEALYPDRETQLEALFEHWYAAGELDKSLPYLDRMAARMIDIDGQYGQAQAALEKLLALLPPSDPRRTMPLNWLSRAHWRTFGFPAGMAAAEEALQIAESASDKASAATSFNSMGTITLTQGKFPEARQYINQSYAIRQELGDRSGIAGSLNNLGVLALRQGKTIEAKAYYEQSMEIMRELGDRTGIAVALNNLGGIALSRGEYDTARRWFEQSLEIRRELGDRMGIAMSLNNLGVIADEQGDYEQATSYHEEGLRMRRELGLRSGVAMSLVNLGSIALKQEDYQTAQQYYEQSLELARALDNQGGIALCLDNLGEVAFYQNDWAKAIEYHLQSEPIRRKLGDGELYISLNCLARAYARAGQVEKAIPYLQEGLEAVRTLGVRPQLMALLSAAEVREAQGRGADAAKLASVILHYPDTIAHQRREAKELLERLAASVSTDVLQQAEAHAKSPDFDALIVELLNR